MNDWESSEYYTVKRDFEPCPAEQRGFREVSPERDWLRPFPPARPTWLAARYAKSRRSELAPLEEVRIRRNSSK
jgi:hypothetical protein